MTDASPYATRLHRRQRRRRIVVGVFGALAVLGLLLGYSMLVEPRWVKIRQVSLSATPTVKLVHLSDIHYKGDRTYLAEVVRQVNAAAPEVICFTGDLVEDTRYLDEAIAMLAELKAPVYGVRGNHDIWTGAPLAAIEQWCHASGGAWLRDEQQMALGGRLQVVGSQGKLDALPPLATVPGARRVLLVHDPRLLERWTGAHLDLALAGHTHGGQARWPWGGPILPLPFVGKYDCGLFTTPSGPLNVSAGIGTYLIQLRFCCRPEIVVVEL